MASHQNSRKFFWFGLIFIFLVGLFGGAFLVLRSPASRGELINSTSLAEGKSSDELLEELLKINQQEKELADAYIPPEDKNLTEEFLQKIIAGGGLSPTTAEKISSNDFLAGTVLPYLKSSQLTLFPIIPDSVLNPIPDSKTNSRKYFKDTNKEVTVFVNAVEKVMRLDEEKIADPQELNDLQSSAAELAIAFENLSGASIPKKHLGLHKKILVSLFSLQKFLEVIINSENDPLKSLLVTNQLEELSVFWQETLIGYDQASKKL